MSLNCTIILFVTDSPLQVALLALFCDMLYRWVYACNRRTASGCHSGSDCDDVITKVTR